MTTEEKLQGTSQERSSAPRASFRLTLVSAAAEALYIRKPWGDSSWNPSAMALPPQAMTDPPLTMHSPPFSLP